MFNTSPYSLDNKNVAEYVIKYKKMTNNAEQKNTDSEQWHEKRPINRLHQVPALDAKYEKL